MSPPLPEPLVVIGAGGHGRETVSLIREAESQDSGRWDLLGIVADNEPDSDRLAALGVRWLGPVETLREIEASVSVAIGEGRVRERLQHRSRELGCQIRNPCAPEHVPRMGDRAWPGLLHRSLDRCNDARATWGWGAGERGLHAVT